jgi:DNA-binding NtrC family response regulator
MEQSMERTKVLVIDDEQIILDSVKKILGAEQFEVDSAISSREGLDRALARHYDLVLSDIRMPEIGGMRILRDIKRAKPALPVVIFTGYATVQSAVQAMKLGASDYIEKPFTPDMLLTTVKKALEKAASEEPERQELVHKDEVIRVLERAAVDSEFVSALFYYGADALQDYDLTGPEKLAILTGDIQWIESQIGGLTPQQKRWLESRLGAEIW